MSEAHLPEHRENADPSDYMGMDADAWRRRIHLRSPTVNVPEKPAAKKSEAVSFAPMVVGQGAPSICCAGPLIFVHGSYQCAICHRVEVTCCEGAP